jgi:hypothetical protein
MVDLIDVYTIFYNFEDLKITTIGDYESMMPPQTVERLIRHNDFLYFKVLWPNFY